MATSLLKPAQEKPARLMIQVPPQLAARLRQVEELAQARGAMVDVNAPMAKALEKLVLAAERDLHDTGSAQA